MQTFSQYATTRLLRSHTARAQTFGGIALQTGHIETFAGVDLITGMPVFIYTMPEKPQAISEAYSEAIPTVLEVGFEHGLGFVVTASAPGYTPLKPVLTQPRLEWLVRASSRALADAHSGGLQHGNLEPGHFFVSGDHLLIEGWGLPWGIASSDYKAPETNISFATDVFAWARCISMFAKGKPRLLPDGEFGRLLGHCLNPRPSERPTAQELVLALEQVLSPRSPDTPDLAQTALELSATEYLETERSLETPIKRTKPLEIPNKPELPAATIKASKPELPQPIEPVLDTSPPALEPASPPDLAPASPPDLASASLPDLAPDAGLESMPQEPQPKLDPNSPEARLDALEAELLPKLNPYTLETRLFGTDPDPEPAPESVVDETLTAPETEAQPSIEPPATEPDPELSSSLPVVEVADSQPALEVTASQPALELATSEPAPEVTASQPTLEVVSPLLEVATSAAALEQPVIAQLSEPEHLAADEPDVALPSRASSRVTEDSDADAPRLAPIRIGFDEDDQSWRSVVSPPTKRPPIGRLVLMAVLIGGAIVLAGILLGRPAESTNPNPRTLAVLGNPTTGSVVTFTMRGAENLKGRLIVVSAPSGSQLATGALLATVPGPVAFPKDGEYRLQLEIAGYNPAELTVRVPQEKQVNLELPR